MKDARVVLERAKARAGNAMAKGKKNAVCAVVEESISVIFILDRLVQAPIPGFDVVGVGEGNTRTTSPAHSAPTDM